MTKEVVAIRNFSNSPKHLHKGSRKNRNSYYSVVILVSTFVGYICDDMSGEVNSDIEVSFEGYNVK